MKTYEDGIKVGEANLRSYKDLVKSQGKVIEKNSNEIKRLEEQVEKKQDDISQHIDSMSIAELQALVYKKIKKLVSDECNCEECEH